MFVAVTCQPIGASGTHPPAPTRAQPSAAASTSIAPSAPPAPHDLSPIEPSGAPASAAASVDPRADGLDIDIDDTAITLEATLVRPGPVSLIIHNGSHHPRRIELRRRGGSGRDRDRIETRTFEPGETLRVEADLSSGRYDLEVAGRHHGSGGLRVALDVREDAPLLAPDMASAARPMVRIVQYAFVPATIEVAAGSTVTWRNDDLEPQTITADDGTFDSRQLDPGETFSVVFGSDGVFAYHSDIHPTVAGTIIVR